ncbi:MAG: stage II sporulation protein P [Clostridium sp.]|uniref:stage II sporulation protein P n=1 Tax=Clostridium sp. TaxID=1506 RepID=UPI002A855A3B|nr:stage II sporulation protein P [Clostridium sp.]MDY5097865.1 stage II sporulation protein P [Clostridium sp.]
MNGFKTNANKMLKLKLLGLFLLTTILSLMILNSLSDKLIKGTKGNIVYTSILNYSIPILTQGNNIGESEHRLNIKDEVLNAFGININNPLSIIAKEIPLFKGNLKENNVTNNEVSGLNPFKLNETSVVKGEESSTGSIEVADESLKKTLNPNKPEVLIYHSHTTESFAPGDANSKDNSKNIVAVGDVLATELQDKYGISVIHDNTLHNDMYTLSYKRSRETVQKYLDKYGEFKLIIDLHRDSGVDKNSVTATVDGQKVAKFMFVISKDRSNYSKNKPLVDRMIEVANKLYPGAMRQTKWGDYIWWYNHGSYHFNQDLRDNMVLIEMGTELNTLDEAKNTAKIIARLVAQELNGKK